MTSRRVEIKSLRLKKSEIKFLVVLAKHPVVSNRSLHYSF